MIKKIFFTAIGICLLASFSSGQANWNFVGPRSNNNISGTEFETSQMSKVITVLGSPTKVFATSAYAGLWMSTNEGNEWSNIDMSPTGLDQAYAIANKNSNEILVGNYHSADNGYGYSTRVSSYNFQSNTWFHYPLFPAGKNTILCVAVHPADQNIIYAGTTIGLFRFNGAAWVHVLGSCVIESIVFTDNTTCFISGSDMACGYPNSNCPGTGGGKSLVYISTDNGNSIFQNFSPNIVDDIPTWQFSHTQICYGGTGIVFGLTSALPSASSTQEVRKYYKITKTGSTFSTVYLNESPWSSWQFPGPGRMAIAYDVLNNLLWAGSVMLTKVDLNIPLNPVTDQACGARMLNGDVHYDIHGLCVDANNNLWVACDGGIGMSSLSNPNSMSFNRKNNLLNVSLLFGFSGSEQDPKLYVSGGQDINNTDIYHEDWGQNKKTLGYTRENDGAFIYKYDDNYMFFDNYINDNYFWISEDKGETTVASTSYWPNTSAPFSASPNQDNGLDKQRGQCIVQDPFREGRVFQLGRRDSPGFSQYSFSDKKMVYKAGFNPLFQTIWPSNTKIKGEQHLQDLSFFPRNKNSLYIITAVPGSALIKYVGPNIDDCWSGHYEEKDANNNPQWQEMTPPYETFQTVLGSAFANITAQADLDKIWLKKVETSRIDQNTIYVAGIFDYVAPNNAIKVLKYDGFNWIDYSYGIPTDAIVCTMIMDHYSKDALYLATDMGVYYRDASMSYWEPYSTGLPNMQITQMEINYKENTLRVSTYGRGIWKSNLKCPPTNFDYTPWISLGYAPSGTHEAGTFYTYFNHQTAAGPNILRATNSIVMTQGFKAIPAGNNTFFEALIHGCNPGSSTSPYLFRGAEGDSEMKIVRESLNDFNLFPNPNNGSFTLQFNHDGEKEIEVVDMLGKHVKEFETENFEMQINLDGLKKGIYFVKVKAGNTEMVKKVVIQ